MRDFVRITLEATELVDTLTAFVLSLSNLFDAGFCLSLSILLAIRIFRRRR